MNQTMIFVAHHNRLTKAVPTSTKSLCLEHTTEKNPNFSYINQPIKANQTWHGNVNGKAAATNLLGPGHIF